MRNNFVKLSLIWTRCRLKDFLSKALAALLFSGAELFSKSEIIFNLSGSLKEQVYKRADDAQRTPDEDRSPTIAKILTSSMGHRGGQK